jgi:hypothetical protein
VGQGAALYKDNEQPRVPEEPPWTRYEERYASSTVLSIHDDGVSLLLGQYAKLTKRDREWRGEREADFVYAEALCADSCSLVC